MMLFWNELTPSLPLYNVPFGFHINGPLNITALENAFTLVRARHQILRTNYVTAHGEPAQLLRPPAHLTIPVIDCSLKGSKPSAAEIQQLIQQEARRPFDLKSDPMLRVALIRSAPEQHALVITLHHIVADGWSLGLLVQELTPAYEAFSRGEEPHLPDLPMQYADFAIWEKESFQKRAFQDTVAFWKEQMSGCPDVCELIPPDHPRPAQHTFSGDVQKILLPLEFFRRLTELGQRHGASAFMVTLAGLLFMLQRYTGKTDVVLGVPMANRAREEFLGIVGCFINQVPIRCDFSGDPSFTVFLDQVRERTLKALFHQEMPFTEIVRLLRPKRLPNQSPLFQVEFVYQSYEMPLPKWPGMKITRAEIETATSKFDLSVIVEVREEFEIKFEYNTDLFGAGTMRSMLRQYEQILHTLLENPRLHLSDFPTGFPCPIERTAASVIARPEA